jgi:hypothetical protein
MTIDFLDLLTVNETSNEPPVDDPEMLNTLALEATFVCNNFSQQVLKMVHNLFKIIIIADQSNSLIKYHLFYREKIVLSLTRITPSLEKKKLRKWLLSDIGTGSGIWTMESCWLLVVSMMLLCTESTGKSNSLM